MQPFERKGPNGRVFTPDELENHPSEEKGKREEKERRRREKSNVSLLAFILATYFGKLLDGKGVFGGNVFKTSARHIHASVIALPKAVLQR